MDTIVSAEAAGTRIVVQDPVSSSESQVSSSAPPTIVHVSLPLQSVIQAGTPSVIHTASGQTIQTIQVGGVVSDGDGTSADEDAETNKRLSRELLARRPSYRKILNDLSATEQAQVIAIQAKVEQDESNSSQTSGAEDADTSVLSSGSTTAGTAVQYTVVPAGAIQLTSHPDSATGLQTLTMTNDSVKPAGGAATTPQGATIVQYAQGPDGQFFIPGNVQYQIAPSTLPQGVVMATGAPTIGGSPQHVPEEASRKRELRLLKNREAARECRRKKKEYVKFLENRVAVLENQNKTLIEELKSLKELYCQKEAQS